MSSEKVSVQKPIPLVKETHSCDVCNKQFFRKSSLKRHLLTHLGVKLHECEVCRKSFSEASTLRKHYLTHTGEKPYSCEICNKAYRYKGDLNNHRDHCHSGVKGYVCQYCNKAFSIRQYLKKHLLIHVGGEKSHVCEVCSKGFTTKNSLTSHYLCHISETPHVCEVCNKAFKRKNDLNQHSRIHSGRKPFQCKVCNKAFKQKVELTRHSWIHSGKKTFQCILCGKSFMHQRSVKKHICHLYEKLHKCGLCKHPFNSKDELSKHLHKCYESHFSTEITLAENEDNSLDHNIRKHPFTHSKEKSLVCNETNAFDMKVSNNNCSISIDLPISRPTPYKEIMVIDKESCALEQPIINHIHHPPLAHSKENSALSNESPVQEFDLPENKTALLTHTHEEVHKPKSHVCEICSKAFTEKYILMKHYLCHTSEQPHVCEVCKKAFKQKSDLTRHSWIHSGKNRFQCKLCKRSFLRQTSVIKHICNPVEKLHKCGVRKHAFNSTDELSKLHECHETHISTEITLVEKDNAMHHNCQTTSLYICELCNKSYKQKIHLKKHLEFHAEEKRLASEQADKACTKKDLKKYINTSLKEEMPTCQESSAMNHDLMKYPCTFSSEDTLGCSKVGTLDQELDKQSSSEEKAFVCEECNQAYDLCSDLEKHMLTHAAEKPMVCEVCSTIFSKREELVKHLVIHI